MAGQQPGLGRPKDLLLDHDDSDGDSGEPVARSGRRKINIEFIEDKSRRHITFSKRKAGIMKKAYELSTLTGTQVLLLVASETGHVYTFATPKLQPLITKPEGKNLIQSCLNTPDTGAHPAIAGPPLSSGSVDPSAADHQYYGVDDRKVLAGNRVVAKGADKLSMQGAQLSMQQLQQQQQQQAQQQQQQQQQQQAQQQHHQVQQLAQQQQALQAGLDIPLPQGYGPQGSLPIYANARYMSGTPQYAQYPQYGNTQGIPIQLPHNPAQHYDWARHKLPGPMDGSQGS